METQSNDKDCLQSQDFMEQEIPLEDRDRGINETLCLGCKELTGGQTSTLTTLRILLNVQRVKEA